MDTGFVQGNCNVICKMVFIEIGCSVSTRAVQISLLRFYNSRYISYRLALPPPLHAEATPGRDR